MDNKAKVLRRINYVLSQLHAKVRILTTLVIINTLVVIALVSFLISR